MNWLSADPPLTVDSKPASHLETVLVQKGRASAVIVVPPGAYSQPVRLLQQAIRKNSGVELPVVEAGSVSPEELLETRNVIALGNMASSAFIFELYRQWYTFLDLKYPGKNGWVVRSLHDPFGTRKNVILLGGSDAAGVQAAVQRFAEQLTPSTTVAVGRLMQIRLGDGYELPGPEELPYSWRDSFRINEEGKPVGQQRSSIFGWNPINVQGLLYHMTGEPAYLKKFLELACPDPDHIPRELRRMKLERGSWGEYGIERPLRLIHHYHAHLTPLIWDLIEESPGISDEQRKRITEDIRAHLEYTAEMDRLGEISRHGTYSALVIYTGARYFIKRDADTTLWKQRMEEVARLFKHWEEDPILGEGDTVEWINTAIWPVFEYYTLAGPKPFVESGMAHSLMEILLTLWSGKPWEESNNLQPIGLMHRAAWMLGEGRYAWLAKQARYDTEVFRIGQSWWPPETMALTPPQEAVNRVMIAPLSAYSARQAGVGIPPEQTYEFLSYRRGLGPKDDFILVDGFNGIGRNPQHVAAITRLRQGGTDLLEGYGSQVETLCDGLASLSVAKAARLDQAHAIGSSLYLENTVEEPTLSTLRRRILNMPDGWTLVYDHIRAERPGTFEITCQWETVQPMLFDHERSRRASSDTATLLCSRPLLLAHAPGPLHQSGALPPPLETMNPQRLLRQSLSVPLKKGETTSVMNVVAAGSGWKQLLPVSENAAWLVGPREERYFTGFGPVHGHGAVIDADAYAIGPNGYVAFGVRELKLGGRNLLKAEHPVHLHWDAGSGVLTLEATQPTRIEGILPADASGRLLPVGKQTMTPPPQADMVAMLEKSFPASAASGEAPPAAGEPLPDALLEARPWAAVAGTVSRIMPLSESGWLVATRQPDELVCFDAAGKVRWRTPLPGELTAMHVHTDGPETAIAVGTQNNQVMLISGKGEPLWQATSEVASEYKTGSRMDAPWFTSPKEVDGISAVLISGLTGAPEVIVGRPSTVEFWSWDGKLNRRLPARWGDCSSLAEVTLDGKPALAVGSFYTSMDELTVIDHDRNLRKGPGGKAFLRPLPEGVTDMAKGLARGVTGIRVVRDSQGEKQVILARSGHWNDVRAFDTDGRRCLWMVPFGPAAPRHLQQLYGKFIRAFEVMEAPDERSPGVVVALANRWVIRLDLKGRVVWSRQLPEVPVSALTTKGRVVVMTGHDRLVSLDGGSGKSHAQHRFEQAITALAAHRGTVLVGTGDGQIFQIKP
ncbi:MAG TPA: PQQ-binding-like beta-propeller repeat protein [Chthoniobacteraceae bacterium]|nr:PQQ-binding-like beta-propeller repeat protein [Chthoniobacteraceae bacterium]